MHKTIPRVEDGRLFQSEKEVDPILIGTPAWYDWLEQQSSFTFVDHALTFTAHKSVLRTGGSYWKAYRKRQGKLYCIHLGHSRTLTLERLHAAAQAFVGEHDPGEQTSVSSRQNGSNRLPRTPITTQCARCRPFHFLDTHQTLSTTSGQRSDPPTTPHRALERRTGRQGHAGVCSCRLWQDHTAGRVGRDDRSSHGLALP